MSAVIEIGDAFQNFLCHNPTPPIVRSNMPCCVASAIHVHMIFDKIRIEPKVRSGGIAAWLVAPNSIARSFFDAAAMDIEITQFPVNSRRKVIPQDRAAEI